MFQHWSDVIAPPSPRVARQFAAMWLVFFVAVAAWRAWHGTSEFRVVGLAAIGVAVGGLGLFNPAAIRWVYTACMVVTFPIGLVVSQVMLAAVYYVVFTPVALVFRLMGRDPLRVRSSDLRSYWSKTSSERTNQDYLRQS